jgi:nucleoside 2-deoxyribosyltransferase
MARVKIYVAGKTNDWERVRRVQNLCKRYGHEITFDWTKSVEVAGLDDGLVDPADRLAAAQNDLKGVHDCQLVIALVDHANLSGTLIEIGIAIGTGKSVWTVGEPDRRSVFYDLPFVKQIPDLLDLALDLPFEQ